MTCIRASITTLLLFAPMIVLGQAAPMTEDLALRQIDAFTAMQASTDPHFTKAEAEVREKVGAIVDKAPPAEWLGWVRRQYFAASERLHREEREQVAAEEREALVRLPPNTPGDVVWTHFERRMAQISKVMETGRWGPRAQALHTLEAARLYMPEDQSFLLYRQARVPLATAYEMGRISRTEYDERWARAGQEFLARQQASDQARARFAIEAARGEAEILRAYEAQLQRPTTTCTSRVTLGRLETTCR